MKPDISMEGLQKYLASSKGAETRAMLDAMQAANVAAKARRELAACMAPYVIPKPPRAWTDPARVDATDRMPISFLEGRSGRIRQAGDSANGVTFALLLARFVAAPIIERSDRVHWFTPWSLKDPDFKGKSFGPKCRNLVESRLIVFDVKADTGLSDIEDCLNGFNYGIHSLPDWDGVKTGHMRVYVPCESVFNEEDFKKRFTELRKMFPIAEETDLRFGRGFKNPFREFESDPYFYQGETDEDAFELFDLKRRK